MEGEGRIFVRNAKSKHFMRVERLLDQKEVPTRWGRVVGKLSSLGESAREGWRDFRERRKPPEIVEGVILHIDVDPPNYPGRHVVHMIVDGEKAGPSFVEVVISSEALEEYREKRLGGRRESVYDTAWRLANKRARIRRSVVRQRDKIELLKEEQETLS